MRGRDLKQWADDMTRAAERLDPIFARAEKGGPDPLAAPPAAPVQALAPPAPLDADARRLRDDLRDLALAHVEDEPFARALHGIHVCLEAGIADPKAAFFAVRRALDIVTEEVRDSRLADFEAALRAVVREHQGPPLRWMPRRGRPRHRSGW